MFQNIQTRKHDERMSINAAERPRTSEDIGHYQMGSISGLLVDCNVAEYEAIKTGVAGHGGINAGDRKKHDPGQEPHGDEDASHHAKEPNEEVGVQSVCVCDSAIVCLVEGDWP
jgi:hypothetical protein